MARSNRRRRWPNIPRVAAELVDRFGWSPVALLNTVDRLTPGRGDRARKLGEDISYGPLGRQQLDVWAPVEPGKRAASGDDLLLRRRLACR